MLLFRLQVLYHTIVDLLYEIAESLRDSVSRGIYDLTCTFLHCVNRCALQARILVSQPGGITVVLQRFSWHGMMYMVFEATHQIYELSSLIERLQKRLQVDSRLP